MVYRNPEFYEERQGRPASKIIKDLDSGRSKGIPINYTTIKEFEEMQIELKEQLEEQTTVLEQTLLELKQIKLHLASLSDEDIEDDDVE